ncbi:MAG: nitroreductase family protein, partial [Acidimicrobiales bacterium]
MARQRACRHFAPDAVPDDDVDRMLDAAVHAPSAENAQPWVF